jgi:16S rRNA (guanine966-N2)-methyltransferase
LGKVHGRLRIIGGKWRSRRLDFASQPDLRPTADRVRETLFNWLGPHIEGARCLDLFAGSGALGFEAVSRGAALAVMVEQSRLAVETLKRQVEILDTDAIQVVSADAVAYLQNSPPHPFDIVFLDPPFNLELLGPACRSLEAHGWLKSRGHVYLECPKTAPSPALPPAWRTTRSKTAGQVRYHLAQHD